MAKLRSEQLNSSQTFADLLLGTDTKSPRGIFTMRGEDSAITGPHHEAYTSVDAYPLFQHLNWAHDDITLVFDAYYDGTDYRSSDAGSNFLINKSSDKLSFISNRGTAAGSTFTPSTIPMVIQSDDSVAIIDLLAGSISITSHTIEDAADDLNILASGSTKNVNITSSTGSIINNISTGGSGFKFEVNGSSNNRLVFDVDGQLSLTGISGQDKADFGLFTMRGLDSDEDGPHLNVFTASSNDDPIFQIFNYNSANIIMGLGAYNASAIWFSSDAGSNARIGKSADEYKILYDSGVNPGNAITWNDGLRMDLTNGHVGLGGAATSIAKLALRGANASASAGPHFAAYTDANAYPLFHQLNYSHDNITLAFDSSYTATGWESSDAGSNAAIFKVNDEFRINYQSGIALGDPVNWNDGWRMDLTNGHIGLGGAPHAVHQLYVQGNFEIQCQEIYGASDLTLFTNDGTDSILLDNSSSQISINAAGGLFSSTVYTSAVSGRDVQVSSAGRIGYLSSTLESKIHVQDLTDCDFIYELDIKSFHKRKKLSDIKTLKDNLDEKEEDGYTEEYYPDLHYGLIAEEVETINTDLVFYSDEGKLEGVYYSKLIAPTIKCLQTHNERLKIIEAQLGI